MDKLWYYQTMEYYTTIKKTCTVPMSKNLGLNPTNIGEKW